MEEIAADNACSEPEFAIAEPASERVQRFSLLDNTLMFRVPGGQLGFLLVSIVVFRCYRGRQRTGKSYRFGLGRTRRICCGGGPGLGKCRTSGRGNSKERFEVGSRKSGYDRSGSGGRDLR